MKRLAFVILVLPMMAHLCYAQINDEHIKHLPEMVYDVTSEQLKKFLDQADSANPKTWDEWKFLADFYFQAGQEEKAFSATKHALKIKPDGSLYFLLGMETESNDKKTAESAYRKAFAMDSAYLRYLVDYFINEKQYKLAKEFAVKFPRSDTDFHDNLIRAESRILAGDYDGTMYDLMTLSNRGHDRNYFELPLVALRLGDTLVQRGKYEFAIEAYSYVEKSISPSNLSFEFEVQEAFAGTIRALESLKDYDREVKVLREYINRHDTVLTTFMDVDRYDVQKYRMTLARLLVSLKQYSDALDVIDRQLARRTPFHSYGDVSDAEIVCFRGVVLRDMGRSLEALEQFHSAIKLNLNYSPAYFELGYTCIAQSRWSEARDAFLRVVDIDTSNDAAWFNLGLAYGILDHKIEAIRCMRKAVALAPSDDQEHETLGEALFDIGDIEGAKHEVEVLRELSSERAFELETKMKKTH